MTLPAVRDTAADGLLEGFEVGYVAEDGTQRRLPLPEVWAVRFEVTAPVRRFAARKGQRHLLGRWWSATDGAHVGYESWLERDHVMALDFDPTVVGIASQPFWLSWPTPEGRVRSHAPDYFARRADGSALVVDCRPAECRPARDLAAFEATRRACELLGWEYWLVGAPDPIVTANLRWLAGYRHPRHGVAGLAEALRAVLRPGDWVSFDGGQHQVLALSGSSVRLRSVAGVEQVVLASYLMAAADFAVVDGAPPPQVEPFGLLDGLSEEVVAEARHWERHVVEVETGLPSGAEPGIAARPENDPAARTLVQRTEAKAAELGVGYRTMERMRARYAQQGLWGLVDRRLVRSREATGRVDARLVAVALQVIEAETHVSTGTRGRLIRRVVPAPRTACGGGDSHGGTFRLSRPRWGRSA